MNGRILTCVYCGHEYPQDTPAAGDRVLTDHIRICEKHPLRKAEADIAKLRAALVGLIGAETKEELDQMELAMRSISAPDADKIVSINAIAALRDTMPNQHSTHPRKQTRYNGSRSKEVRCRSL